MVAAVGLFAAASSRTKSEVSEVASSSSRASCGLSAARPGTFGRRVSPRDRRAGVGDCRRGGPAVGYVRLRNVAWCALLTGPSSALWASTGLETVVRALRGASSTVTSHAGEGPDVLCCLTPPVGGVPQGVGLQFAALVSPAAGGGPTRSSRPTQCWPQQHMHRFWSGVGLLPSPRTPPSQPTQRSRRPNLECTHGRQPGPAWSCSPLSISWSR